MITTQTNKRGNEQTSWICIILIRGNEKSLMKFAAKTSGKTLKTVKCLPNILFNIDTMDLCLLPCFSILFKRRLESVTKALMFEIVEANLKI